MNSCDCHSYHHCICITSSFDKSNNLHVKYLVLCISLCVIYLCFIRIWAACTITEEVSVIMLACQQLYILLCNRFCFPLCMGFCASQNSWSHTCTHTGRILSTSYCQSEGVWWNCRDAPSGRGYSGPAGQGGGLFICHVLCSLYTTTQYSKQTGNMSSTQPVANAI